MSSVMEIFDTIKAPEFLWASYEWAGLILLISGFIVQGLIPYARYKGVPASRLYSINFIALAATCIGGGLKFKLFGTEIGEWMLLVGDWALVIGVLITMVNLILLIRKKDEQCEGDEK